MIGTCLALALMAYDHGAEGVAVGSARLALAARHPGRACRAWGRALALAMVSPLPWAGWQ